MAELNPKYLDRRVAERYIQKGKLSRADYEAHLNNLPDSEKDGEWVEMDLHDTEFDDEGAGSNDAD